MLILPCHTLQSLLALLVPRMLASTRKVLNQHLGCHPSHSLQGLQLKRHIDATLGSGNYLEAVKLPPGEDLNEWLAVNTVDFYNAISILYATLDEFCTERTCEVMCAGPKVCRR